MIYLLLTIICSTSIALILKHNDVKAGAAIVLLAGNYCIATIISFIFFFTEASSEWSLSSLLFGALLGLLFVLTFFAFAKAVSIAGTALATLSSRISVIVPLLLSILIYQEYPTILKLIGFLFTFLTIFLFYRSLNESGSTELSKKDYFFLIAVLLGIGINDFCMKIFQHWRPMNEKPFFLMAIFGFAFVYSGGYVLSKRIKIERQTLYLGFMLGVPNIFSSYFMLNALADLPGIIVYPTINIGIILLTTLSAYIIWRERVNRKGAWALIFGTFAIVLLSVR